MTTQIFQHSGFDFTYSMEGSGETILVPGGPAHYSQTFRLHFNSFRFIFVDHRGFAKINDPASNSRPSMEDLVDDLEQFRKHLNLENFYLLGHSGHASLAMAYATTNPEYVKGLIILSAGPDLSHKNQLAADDYFEEMADPERKKIHVKNLDIMKHEMMSNPGDEFRIFCIRSAARSSFDPGINLSPLWSSMNLNLSIVLHMWSNVFARELITEEIKKLKMPVFIGMGLFDFQAPPHFTWNPIKQLFKNLTFKIYPRSGHNPQMEEPEVFLEEMNRWMQKHGRN
jgi:proline iminopeptidase